MNRLQRAVVLVALADELQGHGSWCGETHIQKATYFLQELLGAQTGFPFILYKHGPFSFELRDELTALRADGLLAVVPKPPYGPSLVPTERGRNLKRYFGRTHDSHQDMVVFVADHLGNLGVSELEKLATALYVTHQDRTAGLEQRAVRLHDLKPHVSVADARKAIQALGAIEEQAKARQLV